MGFLRPTCKLSGLLSSGKLRLLVLVRTRLRGNQAAGDNAMLPTSTSRSHAHNYNTHTP